MPQPPLPSRSSVDAGRDAVATEGAATAEAARIEDGAPVEPDPATRQRSAGAPGDGRLRHRWGWGVALAAYTALVAAVLLWPTPVDDGARDDIGTTLATLYAWGLPRWVDYDLVESAANVVMFVPLGFLTTRLTASPWWGLAGPVALSGAAELAQHLVRPERFATWADVAANTAGAALGVLAAVLVPALVTGRGTPGSTASRRRRARSPRRAPSAPR